MFSSRFSVICLSAVHMLTLFPTDSNCEMCRMFRRSFVTDHKSAQTIPASTKTATFRQMPVPQRRYSAASRYGSCSHFCTIFRLLGRLSGFTAFRYSSKIAAHRSISSSVGFPMPGHCTIDPEIPAVLHIPAVSVCEPHNRWKRYWGLCDPVPAV